MLRTPLTTVAWGLFCACSWTWCIGMFLPKVMLERYGPWGFAVFAIPNVLGCAGFGYVVASPERSRRLIARHGTAMAIFSLVAIGYQMFFIAYLFDDFVLDAQAAPWIPLAAAACVFVVGRLLAELGDRSWLIVAAIVYTASVVAFTGVGLGAASRLTQPGREPLVDLAFLAPVIMIGFLLCPYLDLTFHRALQRSPSRHAFAVFGVTFSVMIVFTLFLWFADAPALLGVGLGHIIGQATFTVGAHLRELRPGPIGAASGDGLGATRDRRWNLLMLVPLVAAPVLLIARLVSGAPAIGEDTYLRFLVFYGLVFPAYVLVFMGPGRARPLTRRALVWFGAGLIVIAPLYEAAYLHGLAWLLLLPLLPAALLVFLPRSAGAGFVAADGR